MDADNIIKQLEAIETLIQSTPSETTRKVLQDEYKRLESQYTQLLAKQQPQPQPKYIVTEQTKSKDKKKEHIHFQTNLSCYVYYQEPGDVLKHTF